MSWDPTRLARLSSHILRAGSHTSSFSIPRALNSPCPDHDSYNTVVEKIDCQIFHGVHAKLKAMFSGIQKSTTMKHFKQGVALTGRNRTGPPWSVGRLTTHAPGGRPARPPVALQTTDADRRQTTTVTSLAPYTMCVRASNKWQLLVSILLKIVWLQLFHGATLEFADISASRQVGLPHRFRSNLVTGLMSDRWMPGDKSRKFLHSGY